MEAPRRDGAPTRTLTAVIAERVKTLRGQARLSGPALAGAMNERGIPWNRTTVAKLETGRRETVTVQELLALAAVLAVPPVWLLADPKAGTPVPIAEGVEVDPWTALMWMTGSQPLDGSGEGAWASAHKALHQLNILASLVEQYRLFRRMIEMGVITDVGEVAETRSVVRNGEMEVLREIGDHLGQFRALQLSIPPMPEDIRKHAAQLGIELPGQDVTP